MRGALPIVAIVGRPNVGKSTLFNRLRRQRAAIVEDTPGVTRDRHYGEAELDDRRVMLVDTGGLDPDSDDPLQAGTHDQAEAAIAEADLVVFLLDGRDGLTPIDEDVAATLRKRGGDVICVVNKVDGPRQEELILEFHRLGLGELTAISAAHGRGINAFVDRLVAALGESAPAVGEGDEPEEDGAIRVAVLGRPNAGKSTLINQLCGDERMLVSDIPGTTRDAVDTRVEVAGAAYVLVDTAGIRKKSKVRGGAERFSVIRAFDAVERADVVFLMVDGAGGVGDQDLRLAELALDRGRSLAILVNKWDVVRQRDKGHAATSDVVLDDVRHRLRFADFAPLKTLCAVDGKGTRGLLALAGKLKKAQTKRVSTADLNKRVQQWYQAHHPATWRGKHVRFYYASQVAIGPPTFIFSVSEAQGVRPAYRRYLRNKIRQQFGFEGAPIVLKFRSHREREEGGRRRTGRGQKRR